MRRALFAITGLCLLAGTVAWTSIRPSHDRGWIPEQRRLPHAAIDGDAVTIHDIRDFRWGADAALRENWDTRSYDLGELETVWYVLTPFSTDWRGPAHAFLSFGFRDGRHVGISVEARREQGESYSMLRGALKRFEIMYVIGDERDLIHLRVARGEDVYVYPIRATRQQVRALFTAMLERANQLRAQPEFYGTLRNNCTTNVLDHVNSVATQRIPYGRKVLLPGYSDQLAHERGLIDTNLTLEQARIRFRVNDRALRHAAADDYSLRIRAAE